MQYERLNDHYQAVHIVDAKTFLKYRLDEAEYKAKANSVCHRQCLCRRVPNVPRNGRGTRIVKIATLCQLVYRRYYGM
jgi:hypothetical protein